MNANECWQNTEAQRKAKVEIKVRNILPTQQLTLCVHLHIFISFLTGDYAGWLIETH